MGAVKIKVSVTIQARIEKVWECYTLPKHIVNWNFAGADWHCPKAENDVRVDGKYSARMEAKDGSVGFDFNTIYTEVKMENKLSYTMEDGRVASTTFESMDEQTIITTLFEAENENSTELQQTGWQMILNNFKLYVENS
jgi:uncharacterized protein YndB with AHSA1/START domain